MINDLISDGLTRIRNAAMRRLDTVNIYCYHATELFIIISE